MEKSTCNPKILTKHHSHNQLGHSTMPFYAFLLLFALFSVPSSAQYPLGTIGFVADPATFRIGQNFLAKCEVTIEPKYNDWRYRVTYTLNGIELAEYEVNGLQTVPIWKPLTLLPGVNIYPEGRSQYPFFYAMVQPLGAGSQGTYQCLVKSLYLPTFPSSQSLFYSNKWHTNASTIAYIPSAAVTFSRSSFADSGSQNIETGRTYSFTAQCTLAMTPSNGNYNVTFRLGRLALGEYLVTQELEPIPTATVIWTTRSTLPGLNLFPKYESASYPNFLVLAQVQSTYTLNTLNTITGLHCSVSMAVPRGGSATFYSDPYAGRANGAQGGALIWTHLPIFTLMVTLTFN